MQNARRSIGVKIELIDFRDDEKTVISSGGTGAGTSGDDAQVAIR